MGTTSRFAWPYPESTDYVADGATAIENLADAVDASLDGTVLQVVSAVYSTSTSVSGTSYINTGLSVTITLSSTSSKVLVMIRQPFEVTAGGFLYMRLSQNGSAQVIDGDILYNGSYPRGFYYSTDRLLTPASTSALTYATEFRCPSGTAYAQVNGNDSTITVMELAG